jgi:hypothetical protein
MDVIQDYSLESAKKYALKYFSTPDNKRGYVKWETLISVLEVGVECGHKFGKKSNVEQRFSADDVTKLFQKLVVRGCFKTDRDYKIATQTLKEIINIDYEESL